MLLDLRMTNVRGAIKRLRMFFSIYFLFTKYAHCIFTIEAVSQEKNTKVQTADLNQPSCSLITVSLPVPASYVGVSRFFLDEI